jgi:hypothetical protein
MITMILVTKNVEGTNHFINEKRGGGIFMCDKEKKYVNRK